MKKHSIKATAKLKKKDWRQRAAEFNAESQAKGDYLKPNPKDKGVTQVVFFKKPQQPHSPKENEDGNGDDLVENNPSTKL